ncbi:MAG: hypothetical protein AB8G05_00790 [Oligoflexales bacterium]
MGQLSHDSLGQVIRDWVGQFCATEWVSLKVIEHWFKLICLKNKLYTKFKSMTIWLDVNQLEDPDNFF